MTDDRVPVGEAPLARRLLAEFVGTALLVGVGAGAITVLSLGTERSLAAVGEQAPQLAQDPVLGELFGGTFADALPVAFAFALVLAVIVYAFGGTSGGHFNPAVTLALAATRRFEWGAVAPYWLAQVAGAIVGALVIAAIYGEAGATAGTPDVLFGATRVADEVTQLGAILAEAFLTFVLVTAIMAVAVDRRAPKGFSGLVIGIALGAGILATGAATGASANFARSLGPLVASLLYDTDARPWSDLVVFAVGPVLGAVAAAFLYESVAGLEREAPAPAPGAATPVSPRTQDETAAPADAALAETAAPVVAEHEREAEREGEEDDARWRR